MSTRLPRAAILITHRVANFDQWYQGFQAHEQARRDHGILGHHVNRIRGDDHQVSVYLAVGDLEGAQKLERSESLERAMKESGVQGTPELHWMKPRSEDIVWDRELPAIIVRHAVKDFLEWKRFYDAAAAIRTRAGILGHATNTLLDDDNTVFVYHQAERFSDLETFLADPELKESMELAGVQSEPEVTFVTGGWSKVYTSPEVSPEEPTKSDEPTAHA